MRKNSLILNKHILYVLQIIILSKIFVFFTAYIINMLFSIGATSKDFFCSWDCYWYLNIVDSGYNTHPNSSGAGNYNFFPVFPFLTKGLMLITGINYFLASVILNNVLFAASTGLLYYYTYKYINPNLAKITTAFFAFSSYSFYFSIGLSESTYLFFMICTFLFAKSHNWIATGIMGAVLSATRSPGAFNIFACIPIILAQFKIKEILLFAPRTQKLWIGMSLFPLGLFLFMLFLHFHTGDALAFLHARVAWGNYELKGPLLIIFGNLFQGGMMTYESLCACFGIFSGIYLIKKSYITEGIILLIGTLIPTMTQVEGMHRFIIALFPLYIALAVLTQHRPKIQKMMLILIILLNGFTLYAWIKATQFSITR